MIQAICSELRLQNLETLDMDRMREFARRSRRKKWLRAAALVKEMADKGES